MKVKFQLNYTALAGLYGKEAQQKATWLLSNEMYDACGSDRHNVRCVTEEKSELATMRIKSKSVVKLLNIKRPNC